GVLHAWEIDGDGVGRHPVSGAVLTPSADGATVDLRLPIGPAELVITLTLGSDVATGAAPVVTDADAEAAMRTLLRTAAGVGRGGAGGTEIAELPEVSGGVATSRFAFEPTLVSAHTGVTAGSLPTDVIASAGVPDALVGAAWPAVFAASAPPADPAGPAPWSRACSTWCTWTTASACTPRCRRRPRTSSSSPGPAMCAT